MGESFLPRRAVALLAQAREYRVKIAPKPNRTFPDHNLEITGPDWLIRLLKRETAMLRPCFSDVRTGDAGPVRDLRRTA